MRFAERMGHRRARGALQVDGMDEALRNCLWTALTSAFFPEADVYFEDRNDLYHTAVAVHVQYFKKASDTVGYKWPHWRKNLREWYFRIPWYEVYDFIEFCLEHLPSDFSSEAIHSALNEILERERSGFRVVQTSFAKITSEEELAAVDRALTASDGFAPTAAHLSLALDHLTRRVDPDYRNSIKEAISAVEAACCVITGNPKATLGQALKAMEQKGFNLHPAQREAFSKLYGYTSDADGIRHALLDEPTLTYEDAQFMLITCSAFVNYLRSIMAR